MRYEITISHEGMNKIRRISGADKWLVEEKARAQKAIWDEQWAIRVQKERQRSSRERAAFVKDSKKKLALDRTEEAQGALTELRSVLGARKKSLRIWSKLKDTASFSEPAPIEPATQVAPPEPDIADRQYQPKLSLFDKLIGSRRRRKQDDALARLESDRLTWRTIKTRLDQEQEIAIQKYKVELLAWEDRKATFIRDQEARNLTVEQTRALYKQKQPEAVEIYNDFLLSESRFPECCPDEHEIRFLAESGILVTDYRLPALSDLPTLKQVKYAVTKDIFEEGQLRPQEVQALYDELMYQICLRVISEIFEHDSAKAVAAVVFNGWVTFVDPATGKDSSACIMSVQASPDEFVNLNLDHVDPKSCFKALKGVGSSKLYGMSAVAPVMRVNREDARFIQAVDVADDVDQGTNLAAIGWEDFEFLIREIFEKEFSKNGGEVKVTRASRDGGVDAVAFDPDPIRGGKIVIQAKRYTNTVGVSAVRDLYGTVMNEGATKGILVTTASYGPDAYAFAKDKPLTLLDGGNLLYLLQEHGHKAYINLAEAKQINPQPLMRTVREGASSHKL